MICLFASVTLAGDIELFAADVFPTPMQGNDGWAGGYAGDEWSGLGEEAHPLSNETDPATLYGEGGPADNWMVNRDVPLMAQGGLIAELDNEQDDTIGLVFSLSNTGDTGYLAFWCNGDCALGAEGGGERAWLVRFDGGVPTELARANAPMDAGGNFGVHMVQVTQDDGHILMAIDDQVLIDVIDKNPLPPGFAGFYAYASGGCDAQCDTDFDDLRIWAHDEDDDRVPDDIDNCEEVDNADQLDTDEDGIGDLCDAPDTTDTDTDTDTDADTDADSDADGDSDTDAQAFTPGEELVLASGCEGCNAAGTGSPGAALGLVLLAGLRSRRVRR